KTAYEIFTRLEFRRVLFLSFQTVQYSNGPIFVYIPKNKDLNIAQSEMQYEDYCYTFSNIEELSKKLKQVLSGDDYLKDNRKKALDYLLNYDATLGQKFIAELRKLN